MKPVVNKTVLEFKDLLWFFPNDNSEILSNIFDITFKHIRENYKESTPMKKASFAYIIITLYRHREFDKTMDNDLISKIMKDVEDVFDKELESYIETLVINGTTDDEKHILICERLIKQFIKNKSSL